MRMANTVRVRVTRRYDSVNDAELRCKVLRPAAIRRMVSLHCDAAGRAVNVNIASIARCLVSLARKFEAGFRRPVTMAGCARPGAYQAILPRGCDRVRDSVTVTATLVTLLAFCCSDVWTKVRWW